MKPVSYPIKHQYQPTNTTCSPTALSMLLSYYQKSISPIEIESVVPQVKDEEGNNRGTINTQLAIWSINQGFAVSLYTFDVQVIDQSWSGMMPDKIKERLNASLDGLEVPTLGSLWSKAYRQAYIDFLDAGGTLVIKSFITSKLLYELLEKGPILPCLCFNTLYGEGRSRHDNETDSIPDDVNGRAVNHSVVIYGVNEAGDFLIADPWQKPGLHTIEPERMLAAISTAQIECDNMVFQLLPK